MATSLEWFFSNKWGPISIQGICYTRDGLVDDILGLAPQFVTQDRN